MEIVLALLAVFGLGTGAGVFVIRNLYYICQPSEVLIFSGSRHRVGDSDKKVGYRLVKGGSSIRVPLLEQAFRMDLSNMIIELKVNNSYSKGGIPLTVESVANIKIAGEEPTIHNAIERLLGKTRQEIEKLAQETLEGNLRGVLASLTPEQVNEDKIAFAKSLLEEAEDDLEKLGLVLDTLQIQNIADDVGYLDSIGRKQQAELLRDSRIAEAQTQAESIIREAENQKNTSFKQIETKIAVARAEAERRIQDAVTKRQAVVAEAEADIGSEVARTQAEVAVQNERIKQVAQQLQADVVAPAEAECKRAIATAKGDAAAIVEPGKAQAEGIKKLAESWKAAGANAREVFLYQKLEELLKIMVSTVPEVDVDNVTVINAQGGSNATKMAAFFEELKQTTGIDVAATVNSLSDRGIGSRRDGDIETPRNYWTDTP
ncbi:MULTISPECIES: flotillin family protein [Okeania]|uniref:Flotillin family protein n=1 Tax=Okeania hirsuta TaxID=1458930 RepID=A0A3N6RRZ8_9CYAN|nr:MULTISPECIES: SPFH domain-containing protein [Okeania]NES78442.1 flotillin family protein [Okeania sp. SIO1H4]NES88401.1 flotillin family protein [Okeania sp. SIO2B9]NET21743.1 flotillin family protein [Okeania sp. SIO1H5]NET76920.1 flotillin family protein [Okeania sp. SIO1F9]NET96878.1 flotillin family protein [Okeania sp. SIO1H2]